MEALISELSKQIKNMDMESTLTRMDVDLKVIGKKGKWSKDIKAKVFAI